MMQRSHALSLATSTTATFSPEQTQKLRMRQPPEVRVMLSDSALSEAVDEIHDTATRSSTAMAHHLSNVWTAAPSAGPRRGSASDVICWQSASPNDYYHAAQVQLLALEIPNTDGNTWVHVAAESKNAAVVADLLDRVDNRLVHHQNKYKATPLHLAAKRDARDVAVVLLARGADALRKDAAGHTALAAACYFGASCNLVTLLLHASQASINEADANGDTPLMMVIAKHHHHLLETLAHAPMLDWTRQNAKAQSLTQIAQASRNDFACSMMAQEALLHWTP